MGMGKGKGEGEQMLNPTGLKTTTHKNLLITAQNKQSKPNLQKFIPRRG